MREVRFYQQSGLRPDRAFVRLKFHVTPGKFPLLEDVAQRGDVSLSGRGGQLVELKPSILQAFDRFLADAMSAHDLRYKLACERKANEQRGPNT